MRLMTYMGECILVAGAINVDNDYQGQKTIATSLVVEGLVC